MDFYEDTFEGESYGDENNYELTLALFLKNRFIVEITTFCPVCGKPNRVTINNLKFHDTIYFKDIPIYCPCEMLYYPPIEDKPCKYYIDRYRNEIKWAYKDNMKKGERKSSPKGKKRKKKIQFIGAKVRFEKFRA